MSSIYDKELQRSTDKYVITARELSSRGMSFVIVMLGVILQASHTSLLMYDVAAFTQEWLKITVGIGIGVFISSALAIFTLKHDGKNKDVAQIITVFFYFEIFTNVFYYWNSLIFSKGFENATMQNWMYLIIAMPFSFIMPFAIKKFAGIINADERLQFGSIDEPEVVNYGVDFKDTEELLIKMKELIETTPLSEKHIDTIGEVSKRYDDEMKEQFSEALSDSLSKLQQESEDKFIRKGHNVEIQVGDKKSIVTLK